MKIAILLTTYNSSRFISELLDSLRKQTVQDWNLYVRDDMSDDVTCDIINKYVSEDSRIHFLADNCKRGAMRGFMWLLEQVEADFYMFCDHDDVWNPNKIDVTLRKILSFGQWDRIPLVVHTDLEVVDENLVTLSPSFWKSQKFRISEFNDKYYHLVYNNVTGCTMMINQKAKELSLPVHPYARMHDSWIVCAVLWSGGKVLNVEQATIRYRQHGKNTVGVNALPGFLDKLNRIKSIMKKTHEQCALAKEVSGISGFTFWLIKIFYMICIYARGKNKVG